jgi:hypothetical protein
MAKLENFIKKWGESEGLQKYNEWKQKTSPTLENFIRRHGEIQGTLKYKERCEKNTKEYQVNNSSMEEWNEKQSLKGGSLDNFIKRHGIEEGTLKYEEYVNKCKNPINKYIQKYGEVEGTRRYNEWVNKTPRSKEDYIRIFGEEDGLIRHADKVKKSSNNLDNFIRLYGETEGKIKYDKFINTLINRKGIRVSKESFIVIQALKNLGIEENKIESSFTTSTEFNLVGGKHTCFYDFYIEDFNLIIDYHGEIYHPQIEKYSIEEAKLIYESNKARKNKFENQLKKDLYRSNLAKDKNFRYLIIWSYDDLDTIENKIKNIINL